MQDILLCVDVGIVTACFASVGITAFFWVNYKQRKISVFGKSLEYKITALILVFNLLVLSLGLDIILDFLNVPDIPALVAKIIVFLTGALTLYLLTRLMPAVISSLAHHSKIAKELEMSEARFNNFMNHAPFIAFKRAILPDGRTRIVYQNDQCKKIFGDWIELGLADEAYLDQSLSEDAHKTDLAVFETKQPVELIEKIPLNLYYGISKITYWKLTKFPTHIGVGCIGIDITEQVRIETELREKNQELELFSLVASHDLQAPLRGILQFTERLQSDLMELDSKETPEERKAVLKLRQSELITRTLTSAQHMRDLCERLLILCRIEKTESPLIATNLDEALNIAISNLEPLIIENHAQIIKKETLPTVIGDPVQLFQLFQNLIANSIKYRQENNPVILIDYTESDNPRTSTKEYIFSIKDNGIGIESKYRDKIFAGFTRLHRNDEYPGFGLGLSICRKIIDRHMGRIWLESEPGQGTTFFFSLKKYAARNRNTSC